MFFLFNAIPPSSANMLAARAGSALLIMKFFPVSHESRQKSRNHSGTVLIFVNPRMCCTCVEAHDTVPLIFRVFFSFSSADLRSRVQTSAAAKRLQELMKVRTDSAVGVRLGVKQRGCNGLSYTLDFVNAENASNKHDEVIETEGSACSTSCHAMRVLCSSR